MSSPPNSTVEIPPEPVVPALDAWLARERRSARPWIVAGESADADAVARLMGEDTLVMSLGAAAARLDADVAWVIDAERLAAEGEAIAVRARWLLVPDDLHEAGWASGRTLASWMADLPVLARLAGEDRLVRFSLWTSGGEPTGALEGAEIPLKLLARAGVRQARAVGAGRPAPAISGLAGLTSMLERAAD